MALYKSRKQPKASQVSVSIPADASFHSNFDQVREDLHELSAEDLLQKEQALRAAYAAATEDLGKQQENHLLQQAVRQQNRAYLLYRLITGEMQRRHIPVPTNHQEKDEQ